MEYTGHQQEGGSCFVLIWFEKGGISCAQYLRWGWEQWTPSDSTLECCLPWQLLWVYVCNNANTQRRHQGPPWLPALTMFVSLLWWSQSLDRVSHSKYYTVSCLCLWFSSCQYRVFRTVQMEIHIFQVDTQIFITICWSCWKRLWAGVSVLRPLQQHPALVACGSCECRGLVSVGFYFSQKIATVVPFPFL